MKYANWNVPTEGPQILPALLSAGCSPLLAAILPLRGLTDADAAREFLSGGAETLSNPLDMEGMLDAVQRLSTAVARGEHVAVYGDYDVDGITAACLLADYLRSRGLCCELYIPDRLTEGYGLNCAAIDRLRALGVTLIVTVDCGVTNLEEAAYAASVGVDMIVTDHHECREALPEAEAVVDPKRPDSYGDETALAGVGVAFKLVCAMDGDSHRVLDRYADLVAVGTVADVMPIIGENRYIVRRGLDSIASGTCRAGFLALLQEAGVADKHLTASTIGYSLAPRINAAGRLGETPLAVALLETEDFRRASDLAAELCRKNSHRQELERKIWDDALAMLGDTKPEGPIVLAAEGWHPGVIGIVASRLTDTYGVPAIMVCLDGENGKGSCRSIGSFNLYEALSLCSDCLVGFGGHAMAAGITVRRDKVDELREKLGEYYREHPDRSVPALEAELLIDDAELLSMECVESLDELEPCGNANPRPQMYMENAILNALQPIGNGRHLRMRLEKFNYLYDCVFFGQTEAELGAHINQAVDVVFLPQINDFRGRRSVQLVITDLRRHEG